MFKRKPVFGKVSHTPISETVSVTGVDDPLSPQFSPPEVSDSGGLFKYLMVCQVQAYGETILEQQNNQYMHQRHLNKLMETYSCLHIQKAIKLAALECKHPYGIKQIKRCCEVLDGVRRESGEGT